MALSDLFARKRRTSSPYVTAEQLEEFTMTSAEEDLEEDVDDRPVNREVIEAETLDEAVRAFLKGRNAKEDLQEILDSQDVSLTSTPSVWGGEDATDFNNIVSEIGKPRSAPPAPEWTTEELEALEADAVFQTLMLRQALDDMAEEIESAEEEWLQSTAMGVPPRYIIVAVSTHYTLYECTTSHIYGRRADITRWRDIGHVYESEVKRALKYLPEVNNLVRMNPYDEIVSPKCVVFDGTMYAPCTDGIWRSVVSSRGGNAEEIKKFASLFQTARG